ncbi:hypothetical protein LIER_29386 [Lithospermum erythrorhizon]|uniref:RNase H type-1 domain-containing protein n=1 Tax=Lithospermum erythrorhizon TaxID=34254 RepID=A0AAV3RPW7_LITER
MQILGDYELALGQKVNIDKCLAEGKIAGWKGKMLSQAEKEILVKSVVATIPNYIMNCFKLPIGIIDKLNKVMAKFFWAGSGKDSGMYWKKWPIMTMRKGEGGLGFKDLECMNLALLARQGWRVGSNPSFGWRSLLEGRRILSKGLRWRFGDGKSIDIWKDPWVPRRTDFMMRGLQMDGPQWVSQLNKKEWDMAIVLEFLSEEDASRVLEIRLGKVTVRDRLVWNHTKSGTYTTSSGNITAREMRRNGELGGKFLGESSNRSHVDGWKGIWKLRVPPRVKLFLWKCLHNALPTRTNLVKRGVKVEEEQSIRDGMKLATDYQEANGKGEEEGRQLLNRLMEGDERWVAPVLGFVKLNCDGAWDRNGWRASIGAVLRGSGGVFLGGLHKKMGTASSALVAEGLVVREDIQFAFERGFRKVEVESDSKYLIQILRGEVNLLMEIDVVITDVIHWSVCMDVKFMFTRRDNNNAAHKVPHWNY